MIDKVSTKSGYLSAMTNLVKQIRKLVNNDKEDSCSRLPFFKFLMAIFLAISHNGILAGRNSGIITVGLQRDKKKIPLKADHISEANFYNELNKIYLLNEEELFDNGYPRWVDPTTKQRAWIKPSENGSKAIFVEDSSECFYYLKIVF